MFTKVAKIFDAEIRQKNIHALRISLKEQYWNLFGEDMPDPVFILGCSRSGTTVTYETIAAAPQLLKIGYEIPQFWNSLWGPHLNGWESEAADAADARPEHRKRFFSYIYARLGQGRVLDKTCINALRGNYLYELFPKAKFVYIQRDGRDNISSMLDGWNQNGHFGLNQFLGAPPETIDIENGRFHEWSFFYPPGWKKYNQASLAEVCAYQWMTANSRCLEAKAVIPDQQWIHLRYEDLFSRPVEMFRDAFKKLDIPFDQALRDRCATLNKRPTSIVKGKPKLEKWREHNPEAIESVMEMICPMQKQLGYDCNT